jgi:hypothetical protein
MARRILRGHTISSKTETLVRTAVVALAMIIVSAYATIILHEAGHIIFALPFGCESWKIGFSDFMSGYAQCVRLGTTSTAVEVLMIAGGILTTAAVGLASFWYYEHTKKDMKRPLYLTMFLFVFAAVCLGSAFLNVALRALQPQGDSDMARIIQMTRIDSRLFAALGFWMLSLLMWAFWEELPHIIRKADPLIGRKELGKVYVALFILGIVVVVAYFFL